MTRDVDLEPLVDMVADSVYVLNTRDGIAAVTPEVAKERARNIVQKLVIVHYELAFPGAGPRADTHVGHAAAPAGVPQGRRASRAVRAGQARGAWALVCVPGLQGLQPKQESAMSNESCPCKFCGTPTRMMGTKMCDACWETQHGMGRFLRSQAARDWTMAMLREAEMDSPVEITGRKS